MLQKISSIWHFLRSYSKIIQNGLWVITIILVVFILGYQILRNWEEIRNYHWQINFQYIILGFVSYSLSLIGTGGIWASIITRLSGMKALLTHIGLYSITNLSQRLPTPFPYIGARTEAYTVRGVSRTTTLSALSVEITVTVVSSAIAFAITLPYGFPAIFKKYELIVLPVILPLILFVIRPQLLFGIQGYIFKLLNRPYFVPKINTLSMIIWVTLFTIIWFNGGVLLYLLANSLYLIPLRYLMTVMNIFAISGLIGWLGQFLFFVPNAALPQVTTAYLLSFIVPWPVAVAIAILARLCSMIFEIVWVLTFNLIIGKKWIRSTSRK